MKNICAIPGMPEFIGPPMATWKFNECSLGIDHDSRAVTGGERHRFSKTYRNEFDYNLGDLDAPSNIAGGSMEVMIIQGNPFAERIIFPSLAWRD